MFSTALIYPGITFSRVRLLVGTLASFANSNAYFSRSDKVMLREGPRNGVSTSKGHGYTPCHSSEPKKGIVAEGGVIMGGEEVLEAKLEDH